MRLRKEQTQFGKLNQLSVTFSDNLLFPTNLLRFPTGLVEYKAAQRLDPTDLSIALDVSNVEEYLMLKSNVRKEE